jgi:HTH-type transcriptional regulator, transcriptional repressor of NAD biosynthesis genes
MKGLIIGAFNPVHKGHIELFKYALFHADSVTVGLCLQPEEIISGTLRERWLRAVCAELSPERLKVEVICEAHLPFKKESDRAVSKIWADYLTERFGAFDALFGSEQYVEYLAEYMDCQSFIYDSSRIRTPVSATKIRQNPFHEWRHIPSVVRPFFVKKICLYGSESVGKTTLAQQLAEYYGTTWVPEMARDLLGDRKCEYEDFVPIARLQTLEALRQTQKANRLLICDTDVITTELYARIYFDDCPEEVIEWQKMVDYDLYLFLETDVPWVGDSQRDLGDPSVRAQTRHLFLSALVERGIPFITIKGDWDERKAAAIEAIDQAFFKPKY